MTNEIATPLFYNDVRPVDRDSDRALGIRIPEKPFAFAAETHLIPTVAAEFGVAAREYPILFAPGAGAPAPVLLVGLTPGRCSFIDKAGKWSGKYVPAYLRRYPFILGDIPGADPILCVERSSQWVVSDAGERLFDEDGTAAAPLENALRLSADYAGAAKLTEAFCRKLSTLGLFREVTIEAKTANGQHFTLGGYFSIDEARYRQLPEDQILEFWREGAIGVIEAHLFSLGSVANVADHTA